MDPIPVSIHDEHESFEPLALFHSIVFMMKTRPNEIFAGWWRATSVLSETRMPAIPTSYEVRPCGFSQDNYTYSIYIYIYKHVCLYICIYLCIYIYIHMRATSVLSETRMPAIMSTKSAGAIPNAPTCAGGSRPSYGIIWES